LPPRERQCLAHCLFFLLSLFGVALAAAGAQSPLPSPAKIDHLAPNPPKLVLQIVADQLRGDVLTRYHDRFEAGGFRYLMDHGVWYTDANHLHAATQTAVGHATLATGAYPSRHGIVANNWYDPKANTFQDVFADPQTTLIGISPAAPGSSPARILTTTFSDELAISTAGNARIFAVSVKDRGAIPLAGHSGKAFWFSNSNGRFISSTYYYDRQYPDWVKDWNAQKRSDRWVGKKWELLHDRSTYLYANQKPLQVDVMGYGATFPHPFGSNDSPRDAYYPKVTVSYAGDELTLEFAEALIDKEKLGRHAVPDYLGISFSGNDLVGHFFSNTSLEAEDVLLRLDHDLALLFAFIDRQPGLGLKNTLIVLAGDHGIAEDPDYLRQLRIPTGRIEVEDLSDTVAAALQTRYGVDNLLVDAFSSSDPTEEVGGFSAPYLYLNRAAIQDAKLTLEEVERTAAEAAMTVPGIYLAAPCGDLGGAGATADAELIAQIRRNQNPRNSGDVYIVQQPQWQFDTNFASGEPGSIVDHGTPWAYDTYVPVIFAGMSLRPARVPRPIGTTDVAATLAARVGTKFPSGNTGVPLPEVVAPPAAISPRQGAPGKAR